MEFEVMSDLIKILSLDESRKSLKSDGNDRVLRALLIKSAWMYGPDNGGPRWARICFLKNGRIGDYEHANEAFWSVGNNTLTLINTSFLPTSNFLLIFGGSRPMLAGRSIESPQDRFRLDYLQT